MPKIHCISDLHLEFYNSEIEFDKFFGWEKSDVLCLAGDIGYPELDTYKSFLTYCSSLFRYVFIIAGNHEYYMGDNHSIKTVATTYKNIKEICSSFPNVYFLCEKTIYIKEYDMYVLGTTLWTLPSDDPDDLYGYNDFRKIKDMSPLFMKQLHRMSISYLEEELEKVKDTGSKVIVLTHHLPTYELIHEKYRGHPMTSLFAVELKDLINKSKVDYWICGHSHMPMDKHIGNTRLILNPIGYPNEHSKYNLNFFFEL